MTRSLKIVSLGFLFSTLILSRQIYTPHIQRNLSEHQPPHSSRTEEDASKSWSFWGKIRVKDTALSDSNEKCHFVKKTLEQKLENIPPLNSEELSFKSSQIYLESNCYWLSTAEKARYSIRLNLSRIKAQIMTDVLELLKKNPPKPTPTQSTEIEIANNLADAYIDTVDKFLKNHPGAKPALGKRIEFLGLQNEINAPWCADWAQGVLEGLYAHLPMSHPIHKWFRFQWGQIRSPQHNFIVVYPAGRPPTVPPEQGARSLLIFDPWKTITPRTYFPGDSNWAGGTVPTNLGIE